MSVQQDRHCTFLRLLVQRWEFPLKIAQRQDRGRQTDYDVYVLSDYKIRRSQGFIDKGVMTDIEFAWGTRLEQERDILKHATAFFARETGTR